MAKLLYLWKNFYKRKNSTKLPPEDSRVEMYINLKTDCSLEHPVFLIDGIDTEYNYCAFDKHCYFIDDIVCLNNNIFELHCSIDLLATHRTEIGNYTGFIERASNLVDGSMIDNLAIIKSPITKNIDQVKIFNEHSSIPTGTYVIGVMGSNAPATRKGAVSYFSFNNQTISELIAVLMNSSDINLNTFNIFQYITSCMYYPFATGSGTTIPVMAGHINLQTNGNVAITSHHVEKVLTIPKHPQLNASHNWLNLNPYSTYTLYIEPFGTFELDSNLLQDVSQISINITTDTTTGTAVLKVVTSGPDVEPITLVFAKGQIGVPVQLAQATGMTYSDVAGLMVGGSSAIGQLAVGNALGSAIATASTIGSAISSSIPKIQTRGGNGSFIAYSDYCTPTLISEFKSVAFPNYSEVGYPYGRTATIGNTSGFVKCTNASIPLGDRGNATDIVNSYMNGGFYYE